MLGVGPPQATKLMRTVASVTTGPKRRHKVGRWDYGREDTGGFNSDNGIVAFGEKEPSHSIGRTWKRRSGSR